MLEQKGKELQLAIVRAEEVESVEGNNLFLTSGAISSDSKNGGDAGDKLREGKHIRVFRNFIWFVFV